MKKGGYLRFRKILYPNSSVMYSKPCSIRFCASFRLFAVAVCIRLRRRSVIVGCSLVLCLCFLLCSGLFRCSAF
jgi:hypothetical protein